MSPSSQPLVSKRALVVAFSLCLAHFMVWGYVVWQDVLYDQGGFEGLLWWVVAFFVLPALAFLTILVSTIVRLKNQKLLSGE